MSDYHKPVLLKEIIEALNIAEGKRYIDATLGGGGHGVEIIRRGGMLLGIDTDREAVEFSSENIKVQLSQPRWQAGKIEHKRNAWKIVQGNFRTIEAIATENGFDAVDGILFDLGVSSHQIDTARRGFSYRFEDAPLDLRLDQTTGETAAERINGSNEEDLYEIISTFGEEELARPIAHAIVSARRVTPVDTVGSLKTVVKRLVPDAGRQTAVLSRVFQGLRIAVNEELAALKEGLEGTRSLLVPGGRLVVMSFHSLEDRIVKQYMRKTEWTMITKKPMLPSDAEMMQNPRARSAKLRVAEKI